MIDANGKNVSVEEPRQGGFSGAERIDFEQMRFDLAEHGKAEGEPPPKTEWTAHEFRELCKKRKLARHYSRKAGQSLLYDELSCPSCSSTRLQSLSKDGGLLWRLICRACGHPVVSDAFNKSLAQIERFAGLELQFLKADSEETEAPPITMARVYKQEEVDRKTAEGRAVEVFRPEHLLAALDGVSVQSGDSDQRGRIKKTVELLIQLGPDRALSTPGPSWQAELDELQECFPSFARAIEEVVRPSLAILSAGGAARPAPLLLVGSPGAGKSFFAATLANMLKVPIVRMDMSSATMNCTLSGLGVHWANSAPGEVFRTLSFGRAGVHATANPVFVLDEIDKVGGDLRFDPIGPLHALLEEASAKCFEDESLPGILMNAGHIRWILTANTTSTITRPILSRIHVVHVPELSEIESQHVRARIFSDVVDSLGISEFENWIPQSVLHGFGNMGPREFKTRCVMAIGKALTRGKYCVCENDFAAGLSAPVRKLGFM